MRCAVAHLSRKPPLFTDVVKHKDNAKHFASHQGDVEVFVHSGCPKAVHQTPHFDHRLASHMPTAAYRIEKAASATITMKIACTNAREVNWPTDSALPATCKP